MKAIYINIDPYLKAVADWLNAGATGTAPCFDPLPVAVTIPLGETACIYCPSSGEAETDPIDAPNSVLPWLGSNDALPLATRMETRLPCRPWRGTLASGHKPR